MKITTLSQYRSKSWRVNNRKARDCPLLWQGILYFDTPRIGFGIVFFPNFAPNNGFAAFDINSHFHGVPLAHVPVEIDAFAMRKSDDHDRISRRW